ncbi:hypothetical protein NC653_020171 [Populus alba x Populus x berolinensis]|uniref:F-box domain-containing protein n=1 Tax=Populus alba x Populus x berolinensis TaxID=444605 RepID=A0AAD6MJT3_9ROSI|nr:hypothetical protein NC653_020171 [Populus alba x Populus x berolinensis]
MTEKCGEDRISELADEVLISVLSFMTMKEAIKTSVLSCRWEKLRPSQPYVNLDAWTFFLKDLGCNGSGFYTFADFKVLALSNSEKKPASSKLSLQSKWLTS